MGGILFWAVMVSSVRYCQDSGAVREMTVK